MKIEVGKTYRTRDGRKAFVFYYTGVFFEVAIADQSLTFNHNEDGGLYQCNGSHALDLVAEWEDENTLSWTKEHKPEVKTHKLSDMWAGNRCRCGDRCQPQTYRLSDMWVVWKQVKVSGIPVFYRKPDILSASLADARAWAFPVTDPAERVIAITRADATEFTEGEGL